MISNLKLDFLWLPNPYKWLGKIDPFQQQWAPEYAKCKEYLKICSTEELIKFYIICYKDHYPKNYWFGWLSNGEASDHVQIINDYSVVDGKYFIRKDILTLKEQSKKDKDDYSYTSDRIFNFKKNIDVSKIIENELDGKTYQKKDNGSKIIYKLIDNPIDFIEITGNSFRLKVNDKYHIHMR